MAEKDPKDPETSDAEQKASGEPEGDEAGDGEEKARASKKDAKDNKAKGKKKAKGGAQSKKSRARERRSRRRARRKEQEETDQELLTLSEVSERTGISMPTLQRYKKNHQDRLPTVGKGRKQRYPVEALPVFQEIKKENISKRGRPRKKSGSTGSSRPKARKDLLTLTEVAERTGISYPTLVRYVKLHRDRIPLEGTGRRKRYYPEAVEVFRQIRSESRRGRRKGSGGGGGKVKNVDVLARRVHALEKSQANLIKEIRTLIRKLDRPVSVTLERK